MPSREKSTFSRFFKEDAPIVRDIISSGKSHDIPDTVSAAKKEVLPRLNAVQKAPEEVVRKTWQSLRSFFRHAGNSEGLPGGLYPALLSPLYTRRMVGSDFPAWIGGAALEGDAQPCLSLKEILTANLERIGPEKNDAHILKENIERIIHIADEQIAGGKAAAARPAMDAVLAELERQLDVSGDELHPFRSDLQKLRESLPDRGDLLTYSGNTSLQLLNASIIHTLDRSRNVLRTELRVLKGKLNDLLRVEEEKGPNRKDPAKLHDAFEFAESLVDFDRLSDIMPEAGTESMDANRIRRITEALKVLEEGEALFKSRCFLFIDQLLHSGGSMELKSLLAASVVEAYTEGNGCRSLAESFETHIAAWTGLFRAKRTGELELENGYREEVHDEFFQHFTWQAFSRQELNSCPYFILMADDIRLFDSEFSKLSAMLSANIPVKVVAVKRDTGLDEALTRVERKGSAWHANTELGALMLSYKNIYITQSTAITPKYLFNGFSEGLTAFAPAFFYLLNTGRGAEGQSYLWTSACVESRDFPGFTYRGLLGTPWGSRFEVINNPRPEDPWPVHVLPVTDQEGKRTEMEFPFTFADLAAMNPIHKQHFMLVDASCWKDELIPLTDYLRANEGRYSANDAGKTEDATGEIIGKVPFIWMMDESNVLQKAAISWQMVLATQERLDFWRFLQENSGINNFHVARAVERAREELRTEHRLELERIRGEHESDIQTVREEEAGLVMERLTSFLLDMDAAAWNADVPFRPVGKGPASPSGPKASAGAENEMTGPSIQAGEGDSGEIVLANDPYIDTALCTSCNECVQLNGAMFKYDGNKLAYIADPRAGTFRDLVEAAEKCPVSIIHPGSPLNPNEPGLEEMQARAAKFN